MAKQVKPSHRGELEITTLNQMYIERGDLNVELLGRVFACLEEIAWNNGWLSNEQVIQAAKALSKNSYGQY